MRVSFVSTCAAALAALAHGAAAAVLALASTAHGGLQVIDVASGDTSVLQVANCCAVQAGSIAADVATQRVYYLANRSGGVDLHAFGYGPNGVDTTIALSAPVRLTHLAFDAPNGRLVGLGVSDAGSVDVIAIAPATGNVTVIAALGANCCTLRAGVVAYQASSGLLYAIGRRSGDGTDQLLAFVVAGGGLQQAYDLGGERVVQLVADGSTLYALSSAAGSTALRLGHFAFTPAFALVPTGSGASGCCFALAGPAAIDHASNTFVALARDDSAGAAFRMHAFSLSSGSAASGRTIPALGLFEDNVRLLDRIFADSFEVQ